LLNAVLLGAKSGVIAPAGHLLDPQTAVLGLALFVLSVPLFAAGGYWATNER
jgi:hypothetical protein